MGAKETLIGQPNGCHDNHNVQTYSKEDSI